LIEIASVFPEPTIVNVPAMPPSDLTDRGVREARCREGLTQP